VAKAVGTRGEILLGHEQKPMTRKKQLDVRQLAGPRLEGPHFLTGLGQNRPGLCLRVATTAIRSALNLASWP